MSVLRLEDFKKIRPEKSVYLEQALPAKLGCLPSSDIEGRGGGGGGPGARRRGGRSCDEGGKDGGKSSAFAAVGVVAVVIIAAGKNIDGISNTASVAIDIYNGAEGTGRG